MTTLPMPGKAYDAAMQRSWLTRVSLSRWTDKVEAFLTTSANDRGPWLTVALGAGIATWFALPSPMHWVAAMTGLLLCAVTVWGVWGRRADRNLLLLAGTTMPLVCAAGLALVWTKSELVGAAAIPHPQVRVLNAVVLERTEQPANDRVRLLLAVRDADDGRAMKVRLNVPLARDGGSLREGAHLRLRARLLPPAPPLVPGAYDFARKAWFDGLSASGTLIGDVEISKAPPAQGELLPDLQRRLAAHVRGQVEGSAGTIAAAFASGDRGAISQVDEDAMRDSGLTHLLSISGLHVSALVGACYLVSLKLLGLWPWLALRVRLPLLAAGIGAAGGVGYTLLTGAEVPTVRSCLAALLVLAAMALGREPLSLRMIAVAAAVVMLFSPEALLGPSFQMSFAAVIAIVALHGSEPMRKFLARSGESLTHRLGRQTAALFLTGVVIELALTPIVMFHFHRSGFYGAFANVMAIPLVTFCAMPLIAFALLLDVVGVGAPAWWAVEQSLNLLLEIARFTAAQPGAVRLFPQMDRATIALFAIGGMWLALWRGPVRLAGLLPVGVATILLILTPVPDVLVTGDGKNAAIRDSSGKLLILRGEPGGYAVEQLQELSATDGDVLHLASWRDAACSPEFCVANVPGRGREWRLLLARNNVMIEERQLAAACSQVDIVIAGRRLPRSCRPAWLKADRQHLSRTGGIAIYLDKHRVEAVADHQGRHGWWSAPDRNGGQ
ncbi:ComEC/Rec2 family competence protein [Porphyrobacter sp. GA68]|uniref:ComEC/Rec2 family competence protein n=1 Tax=Porphyrobacter sp. GA68 TaxID=2883480 RepID=UPI001F50CBE9|nr:ComEC/Rec2 family competence protein [Porphyrobacter sp. GA68]